MRELREVLCGKLTKTLWEIFRSDAEVEKVKKYRDEYETKSALIGFAGFALSVLVILWALIILVRFFAFDNFLYNFFVFCMLLTGDGINEIR